MSNSKEKAEIKDVFNGLIPLIFQVMDEKGVLSLYWPLVKNTLVEDPGIQDPIIKQGLMVALSTKCDNSYCFIAHSYFLHGLGISIEAIEILVSKLEFPSEMKDSKKWSLILKWSFLFARPSIGGANVTEDSNKLIQQLISKAEYRNLFKIFTTIDMLNRFSEFYSEEVKTESESMFFDSSARFKLPIPNLVKYYEKNYQSGVTVGRPVVTICSYCKDIQDTEKQWHALESILAALDRNSTFSHGICPDCYKKVLLEID